MSKTYTSSERAYHDVKERILSGQLAGGELISEGQVAAEIGTSRTPVREAFLRLEVEGWMKLYPKRGALVVPIPADEAEHVVQARYVVETASVRTLANLDRTGLVSVLRSSNSRLRELAEANEIDMYALESADFHRAPVVAAGNPLLLRFYDSLRDHQRRMAGAMFEHGVASMELAAEQHVSLVDCIERGDVDGFANELAHHLFVLHRVRVRGL